VRRVIHDLRPIYLEDLGLAPAIEMLTQSLPQADRLAATCTIEGETRRLAPEHELAVYRIVQEALNNVVKHARAQHVQVHLRFSDALVVSIHDDGVGFAMPDRVDALTERGHFGLIGMRERAELIGARLVIHSSPGQGTTVELTAPPNPLS
jgi:two-component system, NarL family, sensor histidine kinase UhpB